MEVKINKEIRDFTESIFFGLSLRQCFFAVIACVVAVTIYFLTINTFGLEITSWLCMLGAAPFAALGFIKYQGMNAEQLLKEAIRSFFLSSKQLTYQPFNLYYESVKDLVDYRGGKRRDKKLRKIEKAKQRKNKNTKKSTRHSRSRRNL